MVLLIYQLKPESAVNRWFLTPYASMCYYVSDMFIFEYSDFRQFQQALVV